ncbi:hypothetical protein AgCh_018647 [Apium graveolens]
MGGASCDYLSGGGRRGNEMGDDGVGVGDFWMIDADDGVGVGGFWMIEWLNLDKEGYRVTIGDKQWNVIKRNLVIARGEKKRTLYIVEESSYEANIDADEIGSLSLWYKRPGYMSEKGMKLLTSKGEIPELKNVESGFCEPWFLGKKKCVTFAKSGRTPKTKKLELVHTYIYGPTTVVSLDKSLYYVTIINDFTKKIWVYFLKNKSDVFSTFKKWKTEVENLTGLKVKSLMSDNGGEYSSNEYKSYCTEFGIRMIKNIVETPQQNGVTECMNRTLNERANSMRLHAGLPKMF